MSASESESAVDQPSTPRAAARPESWIRELLGRMEIDAATRYSDFFVEHTLGGPTGR